MSQPMLTFVAMMTSCSCLVGCPQGEACTQADLAKIEADYQAELALHCMGQGKDCTERPAIDAKYHTKRIEWIQCKPKETP